MKKAIACVLALVLLAALAACGKTPAAPGESGATIQNESETEIVTQTEPEPTTEPEPETVSRPTADGQAVEAYDISF